MERHTCESVLVTCIDFRLQPAINKWAQEKLERGGFDRVALAGGVKNFETILGQVDIAVRLHHIKRVVFVNHEDCGAYGEEGTLEKHTEDLSIAKTKVKELYPDLVIKTYYLHLDGTFEPIA